jgi:pyruvate formate lyase activating enzyme
VREAAYYEALPEGKVQCHLCPHECRIAEDRYGLCNVRVNRDGTLYTEIYGQVTSVAMDPIEKKPLYHFHPGTQILSLGTRGCSFACKFCQNWTIAQGKARTSPFSSEQAVAAAHDAGAIGIAYTYNEPLIGFEYLLDTARMARDAGLANVLVTNGYVMPEPFDQLLPLIDAINLDIKSIRPDFYKTICRGRLQPVLDTARTAAGRTHLEVTNLVIPGHTDSDEELAELAGWIAENLGTRTPVHLSAYFPRHELQAPPTPPETLERARQIFTERLAHVYLGNIVTSKGANTYCHECGAELISRRGYTTRTTGLQDGRCAKCGREANVVT